MNDSNYKKIEITTDVLVIGGGIAGLSAAVSIKEKASETEVLIVEKQTAGYSGKANKGGGVLQYFDLNKTKPEAFVAYHANSVGCFLGDQELMHKYVSMNNDMIDKLIDWGVKVPLKDDGTINVFPTGPMVGMIGVDLDITVKVRKTARKKGVKIMDKVTISDLLTNNGRITGATGYSILDGTFYTIKAKSVILATGSQNYRIGPMWSSGRGDGIAAAYRAGAVMRNPEFGNFAQLYRTGSYHEVVFGENVMYNALGDNITKNFRRFPEADINSNGVAEWYKQMSIGKGPIYIHPEESELTRNETMMFTLWDRPYGLPFWKANFEKAEAVDKDWEVIPSFAGEQSPIKVDHDMQTTIEGLFAIGDASYCGSTAPGAVPAPPGRNRGSGILNAVFAAIVCSDKAVKIALEPEEPVLDQNQVKQCIERAYAPLLREKGVKAREVIEWVQNALCPMEYSVYMSEPRLNIALRKINKARQLVQNLKAVDFHDLLSCHEAEAMVLSAEMQLKGSLLRKESRGWFMREDYPKMDNANWLKWITVKDLDGEMIFDTEDVPIDKWPIKPPDLEN